ncbi:MAG: phosphopantetheine-binding protein [Opitutales bacterium]|jgi:3-hydroxyacyl-[acyl-carrier-protein] dehydratase
MTPEQLNESMRRCPPDAVEAALAFQTNRDPALIPTIVLGIIERFVEPDMRPKVRAAKDETRLNDELGIDSLIMVEIVMTIEEVLQVSAPDEELRTLRTIGDIKKYLDAKIRGIPYAPDSGTLSAEAIAAALPQQPPFLFLQSAKLAPDSASGSYRISGNEPAILGHFKDEPVFPASLMIEALGQLASLFLIKSGKPEFEGARSTGKAWFSTADMVRCQRVCRPADTLCINVKLLRARAPLATFSGTIDVDGQRAASVGELTLAYGEIQPCAAEPLTSQCEA